MKGLREFLRPEFLSRIDEIVVFRNLEKQDFAKIAGLMLEEMREPLLEKDITLAYDDAALAAIAEKAYGKPYGARDIRRVIRRMVEDQICSQDYCTWRKDPKAFDYRTRLVRFSFLNAENNAINSSVLISDAFIIETERSMYAEKSVHGSFCQVVVCCTMFVIFMSAPF